MSIHFIHVYSNQMTSSYLFQLSSQTKPSSTKMTSLLQISQKQLYQLSISFTDRISMHRKTVLAIIINLMLLISVFQLLCITNQEQAQLDQTTKVRFLGFIFVHGVLFVAMIVVTKVEELYSYIVLGFFAFLAIVAIITAAQRTVKTIQNDSNYSYSKFAGNFQKQQLTYLNIYFLAYMYSIIGLITCFAFLLATELLICYQEYQINSNLERCLTKVLFSEKLKGKQCSICLQDFEDNGNTFSQIVRCKHVFHQECLLQWIVHNKTCPLDRSNIFDNGREERGERGDQQEE